jgi:probable H4MPT-linked C1 transfer pathway protein
MSWLALDIGGANLKAADGCGWATIVPFALWKSPAGLAAALTALLDGAPPAERIAVTMTGELCDCFFTKTTGVRHILDAMEAAANGREILVYLTDGRFVSIEEARKFPQLAAASNWHALAQFASRFVGRDSSVLIDIGSTTTDIVPIVDAQPRPRGFDDTGRLLAGELVYTGVGRTPVCAITRWLPWRGMRCHVAAEIFATSADAYVVLTQIPEQASEITTADGRPLTIPFAQARLARMICADTPDFSIDDARRAADRVREAQLRQVRRALRHVMAALSRPPVSVVISGSGEFLARQLAETALVGANIVSLASRLGPSVAVSAAAHALAVLANDRSGGD